MEAARGGDESPRESGECRLVGRKSCRGPSKDRNKRCASLHDRKKGQRGTVLEDPALPPPSSARRNCCHALDAEERTLIDGTPMSRPRPEERIGPSTNKPHEVPENWGTE